MGDDEKLLRLLRGATWIGSPAGIRFSLGFAVLATLLGAWALFQRDWLSLAWIPLGWGSYWGALRVRTRRAVLLGDAVPKPR